MSAQLRTEARPSSTLPLSDRFTPSGVLSLSKGGGRYSRLRARREELVERYVLRLICLGIAILSLAGLLYLTQRSTVTTTVYEIQELQLQKERLQRERDRLRADVARLTAPERVRARAEALGFEPARPAEFVAINAAAINMAAINVAAVDVASPAPSRSADMPAFAMDATSIATQHVAGQPVRASIRAPIRGPIRDAVPGLATAERWSAAVTHAAAEAKAAALAAAEAALHSISAPRQAEAWYGEPR